MKINTNKIVTPKAGINNVTMGKPYVGMRGAYKMVSIPFYTKGADYPKDASWFIPQQPTSWATVDELASKMAREIMEVYELFIPLEQMEGQEFSSFEDMISKFNQLLPEDFTTKNLEVVMCYGKPNKEGKTYLNVASENRYRKELVGKRWFRDPSTESEPLSWGDDFQKRLTQVQVPTKTVTINQPTGDASVDEVQI
jgi:hypothetical protein